MDISKDPLALILIIITFATTFHFFAPRVFRFFCIGMGLSWWRGGPMASVKTTIDICTAVYLGESHLEYKCGNNVGYLGCQIVVYFLAVMCALTELEHILTRRRATR